MDDPNLGDDHFFRRCDENLNDYHDVNHFQIRHVLNQVEMLAVQNSADYLRTGY
jgi:hypothetical protein